MKKDNVRLTTVGKLLKDLKRYERKHWDRSVVARIAGEDRTFGVMGTREDKEGDFQIVVEEIDEILEGIWTVADVISSMEDINKETRVYLAGDGLYLAIDSNGDIFTEDDDNDVVGCYVTAFGEYEEKSDAVPASRKERDNMGEIFALIAIMVGSFLLVFYKAYALITGTGGSLWESTLYIVGAMIAAAVCGLTLYYSRGTNR